MFTELYTCRSIRSLLLALSADETSRRRPAVWCLLQGNVIYLYESLTRAVEILVVQVRDCSVECSGEQQYTFADNSCSKPHAHVYNRNFIITSTANIVIVNTVQEGWLSPTERASVSAISLIHILVSPRYAPGTTAVNVTRMKRVRPKLEYCVQAWRDYVTFG